MKVIIEDNNGEIREYFVFKHKLLFNDVTEYTQQNIKSKTFVFLHSNDSIYFDNESFLIQKYSDQDFQFAIPKSWNMSRNDTTLAYVDGHYLTTEKNKVEFSWILLKDSLDTHKNVLTKILNLQNTIRSTCRNIYDESLDLKLGRYSVLYSFKSDSGDIIKYICMRTDYDYNLYQVTFETKELYFNLFNDLIEKMDENTYIY